jgi:hypothetical protein
MALAKHKPRPSHPQPSAAQQAFLALEPELEALVTGSPKHVALDVQLAGAVAHSVATRDLQPQRFAMFERLARAELYDIELPARIDQLALATWFTRQRQLGRLALHSAASVPLDMVRTAQRQRRRMLRVLDHWLDDEPTIVAEVAAIRAGAGYQDLANDLEALADIYQRPEVRAVIVDDRKHYQAGDVASARTLARGIFDGLGLDRESDVQRWSVLCLRAWSLLVRDYEEHREVGSFLFRKLEDVSESYPSLFAACRRPSRPTASKNPVAADGQEELEPKPERPEAAVL